MISVYGVNATDFSTVGTVLDAYCTEARINERLNGEYRATLELEITPETVRITPEMVIKMPAPIRITPEIDIKKAESKEIWAVNTNSKRLTMHSQPSYDRGYVLHSYDKGTEMVLKEKYNSTYYKMIGPDGRVGYMLAQYLRYVRTENTAPINSGVVESHATREQLFRINRISSTLDSILVEAVHISYDLRRNYMPNVNTKNMTGVQAMNEVFTKAYLEHEFNAYTDISKKMTDDIAHRTVTAALLSDGGLISQLGGELLRDNFDVYWVEHIGENRGASIAYKKNMAGMDVTIDTDDLITRIIPVGFTKDGKYIIGNNVDSEHINQYPHPYLVAREYRDVKIGSNGFTTEAQVKTEIAKRARAEFDDDHIDIPSIKATVDFVSLRNTDANINIEEPIFMGDTVRIKHEDYGFNIDVEVNAYEYDSLADDFVSVELGDRRAALKDIRISPSQIANDAITGRMLTLDAGQYLDLSGNMSVENAINASASAMADNPLNARNSVNIKTNEIGRFRIRDNDDVVAVDFYGNVTNNRAYFAEYARDGSGNYERYALPTPETYLPSTMQYDILTTKAPVSVAQGGTGAKGGAAALKNLGLYYDAGTALAGTTAIDITFNTTFGAVPVVTATGSVAGNVTVTNVTKTGFKIRSSVANNTCQWIALNKPPADAGV